MQKQISLIPYQFTISKIFFFLFLKQYYYFKPKKITKKNTRDVHVMATLHSIYIYVNKYKIFIF